MENQETRILGCALPSSLLQGNMTSLFRPSPFTSDTSTPRTALAQVDYIADRLHKSITNFRMHSFHNFGIDLSVYPTADSKAVTDLNGKWLGFDQYNFDVHGQSPKAMDMWLTKSGSVRIWYRDRWHRVAAYLKHLKPAVDYNAPANFPWPTAQQCRWDQQSRWWLANGKKFRLMDLPAEIREMIYVHVIGSEVEPDRKEIRPIGGAMSMGVKPIPSLLRISKTANAEASNILFSYTPFVFKHFRYLNRTFLETGLVSRIRHLELALTHDSFNTMFAVRTIENEGRPDKERVFFYRSAMMLRKMKLTRLRLVFAAPSCTTRTGWFDGSCQKAVVQIILEDAWDWVKGHPLELGGFIKRRQKEIWETACREERKKFLTWRAQTMAAGGGDNGTLEEYDLWTHDFWEEDGGVFVDGVANDDVEDAANGLVEDGDSYSFDCSCRVPCAEEEWDPED